MRDQRDTALASLICERNDHPDAPACDGCYAMAAWLREHGYRSIRVEARTARRHRRRLRRGAAAMTTPTLIGRLRSWLAGVLFGFAGRLDSAYDVWLDDAPRRTR